ncbi:hypothetical protein [Rhodanobacter sp. L36]|nr:hypothetical protein [Rhodanobacter sp. L36]
MTLSSKSAMTSVPLLSAQETWVMEGYGLSIADALGIDYCGLL